jgi:hypothetical protein
MSHPEALAADEAMRLQAEREGVRRAATIVPVADAPIGRRIYDAMTIADRREWVREMAARLLVAKMARGDVIDPLAVDATIEIARAVYDETGRDEDEETTSCP